ncbi:MAG TPA: alkaline phosphatase family protein [Gemmatimonadaceae bacterium]
MSVIILVADGARADAFDAGISKGTLPSLALLRAEGGLHAVTTVFPSVTGPAYTPFLTGRFPGPIGLPGLRWYDRTRTRCTAPPHCRSYLGSEMRHMDGDLDAHAPTIFELARSRFSAMSMIGRGTRRREQIGRGIGIFSRIVRTHWTGNVGGWLEIDRVVARLAARRIRDRRPELSFVALLGLDKTSHASGHESSDARGALRALDTLVAQLRHDAERSGTWDQTQLWVVSDHGHSSVHDHDDLALAVQHAGYRVMAHPWIFTRRPDVAVMVSGNAMAHLYLELSRSERPWWPELRPRWEQLAASLLERPSVDLILLPHTPSRCEVRARGRGAAFVEREGNRYAYRPLTGDPLGLGPHCIEPLDSRESYDVTMATDYPDSLVQIAHLAGSARSGELILSAARGWDFRAHYEPIPHVSTHGALHREHMLVPLLVNHPINGHPRRTVDVMPSALKALGITVPAGLDGAEFN